MESRMVTVDVKGKPVTVKVCVNWNLIAKKLVVRAQSTKSGRASECFNAVQVHAVPKLDPKCDCSFLDSIHSNDCPCHPEYKRVFG